MNKKLAILILFGSLLNITFLYKQVQKVVLISLRVQKKKETPRGIAVMHIKLYYSFFFTYIYEKI